MTPSKTAEYKASYDCHGTRRSFRIYFGLISHLAVFDAVNTIALLSFEFTRPKKLVYLCLIVSLDIVICQCMSN